ncbi:hypothetical protein P7L64_02505 (plasmid) [Tistrella bauzanensis]|uniref:hypothetical protein n=1 Tax=Tistrella bauzanensis TaxID=657419 RepID=UPI001665856B|nr:hypothetical protein [Tistrella bauzanensis]
MSIAPIIAAPVSGAKRRLARRHADTPWAAAPTSTRVRTKAGWYPCRLNHMQTRIEIRHILGNHSIPDPNRADSSKHGICIFYVVYFIRFIGEWTRSMKWKWQGLVPEPKNEQSERFDEPRATA